MKTKKTKLFDVVVFNIETHVIASVAGFGMDRDTGHYNAENRLETVLPRLNESYSAAVVPSGKFTRGDVLPKRIK